MAGAALASSVPSLGPRGATPALAIRGALASAVLGPRFSSPRLVAAGGSGSCPRRLLARAPASVVPLAGRSRSAPAMPLRGIPRRSPRGRRSPGLARSVLASPPSPPSGRPRFARGAGGSAALSRSPRRPAFPRVPPLAAARVRGFGPPPPLRPLPAAAACAWPPPALRGPGRPGGLPRAAAGRPSILASRTRTACCVPVVPGNPSREPNK